MRASGAGLHTGWLLAARAAGEREHRTLRPIASEIAGPEALRNVEAPVIRYLRSEEALRVVNASDPEFRPSFALRCLPAVAMVSCALSRWATSITKTKRS
jgi:hypothetical protein